ncbi:MAG: hypothetical protein GY830_04015 [Bacteroidetes bacterium]|nr:hypothetical protein [Bacteroidota bacterium]
MLKINKIFGETKIEEFENTIDNLMKDLQENNNNNDHYLAVIGGFQN